jgi:hypothetical protein
MWFLGELLQNGMPNLKELDLEQLLLIFISARLEVERLAQVL